MKTNNTKNNIPHNTPSSKPFFTKNGEGTFLSEPEEIKAPFFTPAAIQPKLNTRKDSSPELMFNPISTNDDESPIDKVQRNQKLVQKAFINRPDDNSNEGKYSTKSSMKKGGLGQELMQVLPQSNRERVVENPNNIHPNQISITSTSKNVIARLPSPNDCHTFRPGLAYMKPIIKEGYDGGTYTAIKSGWEMNSWKRRWQVYDANDDLLYESYYTWPSPTLYIPKDVVEKGQAGGKDKSWSVWIKVTETLVPFGGSDSDNFPHSYMKFNVYETWNDYMADPDAKLSAVDEKKEANKKDEKSTPLDSSVVDGARSVVDYGSAVAMHEAYLREIYDSSAKGITNTAKELVEKGMPQHETAKWAIEARNQLKAKIRADGNPILKKVFEARNLNKYGNKLGPTYEQLFQKYSKQGLKPAEINKKIVGSSGRANVKFNRWSGRLRVAGRIMIAIDIVLAGVKVYLAPEGKKVQVALEELARIGGALAMGAVGAKGGAAAGAAIGALFAGVGAAPGAIIGGIIGGIGGAVFGGWLAKSIVQQVYEMFPPSDCVFEGDFVEEEQPV